MSMEAPDPHETIVRLRHELANVHRVHINDIRALMSQFEIEQAQWSEKLQQAVGRECGALCGDIEQDREELTREVQQLREEGVPGVMHQADMLRMQVVEGDRDRFANLHANLVRRNRNLVGEFRAARHAARSVRLVEGLLADALGREPGSINSDNIEGAFTELVRQRDQLRERVAVWAAPDSSFIQNNRILTDLERRFSEVIGTDVRRDRMVEVFDHLVRTFHGQANEIEVLEAEFRELAPPRQGADTQVLQDTIDTQKRTIDIQVEDLATKRRTIESLSRQLWETASKAERQRVAAVDVERQLRDEKAAHAGLQSAAKAVGEELTRAYVTADRARLRHAADTDLLHTAMGIICNAEDMKLTLPCLSSHCVEGDHVRDTSNPQPIGDPEWKEAAQRWFVEFHAREATRNKPISGADPLAEFAVQPVTNGQFQWVYVDHIADGCRTKHATYPAVPRGDTPLSEMVRDAHQHLVQCLSSVTPDEASPDDAEDTCGHCGYPEHGPCSVEVKEPPTEVDE